MKAFNVWIEGYSASGNREPALLLGTVEADSFKDACITVCKDKDNFNSSTLSIWGCDLYDNELDARKAFG